MFLACTRRWTYYERQILRLERTLHAALATDALTDKQHAQIFSGLNGNRPATVKDARLLNDAEATLVRHRSMDPSDRQMLRTLLARLDTSRDEVTEGDR